MKLPVLPRRAAGFTLAGTREATDAIVEQLLSLK